jgi:putative ABC transport system ATP-binding protein
MVRIDDVSKAFLQGKSRVQVLNGVSLEVAEGELLVVMGPSGSGKSTLLHLVGGLDAPDGGEIFVEGSPLSRMSDDEITLFRRRRIGFVFQFFHLLPTLTVEENVALPRLLDGQSMATVRPRVESLLERVGLAHRRSHRADALSGGEAQRVAIARALVIDPVLLLADEPTGSLDSHAGSEILELFRSTVAHRGRPAILVTHDVRAAACGDRVVAMRDGRIIGETRVSRQATESRESAQALQFLSDWYRGVVETSSAGAPGH